MENDSFFDTLTVVTGGDTDAVFAKAAAAGMNLRKIDSDRLGISLDETTTREDLRALAGGFRRPPMRISRRLDAEADARVARRAGAEQNRLS